MGNQFTTIFNRIPKRNKFNMSFENKLTCGIGQLIPVMTQEILPGDKMHLSIEHILRFQPLVGPMMQRVDVCFHAFFVPNRLLWNQWEDFITGGKEGTFTAQPPQIIWDANSHTDDKGFFKSGSLFDYLGFPTWDTIQDDGAAMRGSYRYNALPFRAYVKIWSDYFRDENLTVEADLEEISGNPYTNLNLSLQKHLFLKPRCYSKDYFTSALPEPQRGPDVTVPVAGELEIGWKNWNGVTYPPIRQQNGSGVNAGGSERLDVEGVGYMNYEGNTTGSNLTVDNSRNLEIKGEQSTTITDLRRAFKVQEWQEKMSRGGHRYIEQILNFFGVRSSDARLQRAEYLGGLKSPVVVSPVYQTSSSIDISESEVNQPSSALGEFAGNAQSISNGSLVKRFFEEHGWVMVLMSVMPKSSYYQGVPRKYLRTDKTDYYWPQFAHIGEQEIKQKELFVNYLGDSTLTADLEGQGFGYSPRYAEYRFNNDEVHGEFRTNLEFYHMGRKFGEMPRLANSFMEVRNSDVDRVFAVNSDKANPILADLYLNCKMSRLVSRYGNPRL